MGSEDVKVTAMNMYKYKEKRNLSLYSGASPLRTLKVIKSNLNSIGERTGNQCNSRNSGRLDVLDINKENTGEESDTL